MQSTRIQLIRNIGVGAVPPGPANLLRLAEPAYGDPSTGGNGMGAGGTFVDFLYIGHGGTTPPTMLVGNTRQLELTGQQILPLGAANAKWFDASSVAAANFKLTGGANADVLVTDGSGGVSWHPLTAIGGLVGISVSAPLTPTTGTNVGTSTNPLGLTMADATQITAGVNTVFPISSAGLRGVTGDLTTLTTAVTARGSLVDAINDVVATVGSLDIGVTTNVSLVGDGTSVVGQELRINPANALQVTTGTDNVQAITSLRLREVTGALTDLDVTPTARGTLVEAINDLSQAIGTLQSGITIVGTFNAATNIVTPYTGSPIAPGPLPSPGTGAGQAPQGWVLKVVVSGNGGPSPPAPGVPLVTGDELMSPGTGTMWDHTPLGAAPVVASGVAISTITGMAGVTTVQGALEHLHTNKISSLNLDTDIFLGDGVSTPLTIERIDGGTYT